MKNIFLALSLTALVLGGCKKPYDDKSIGEPIYSADHARAILNGKWVLRKATHVDEKSLVKESIDITDFFTQDGGRQPNITFDVKNQTYTSDTTNVALNYFGTGGSWKFDDNTYPTLISLNTGTGIINIPIGANLESQAAFLSFTRSLDCSGATVMTYKLELIKQQ